MKSRLTLSICCLTFFMTGCLHPTIGPKSIPRDRAAFGISIGESWQEQMLLNIVKMRYIDTPVFVGVGSIVMSYTLTANATAAGAINPWNTNSGAALGLSGTFANTPTITYTPMSGSAFIQGLLTPLPAESVFRAIQNGAPADNIMLSSVCR